MKLIFKSLCVSVVLTVLFSFMPFEANCESISQDVFRLHILANSDSETDQALKIKVRDRILEYTNALYSTAESKDEAIVRTADDLQKIANIAKETICEQGYDYAVQAEVTDDYFDTRTYDTVTMPSGTYKALRVTIGEGKGHNWWCVMYPSLCVGAGTNLEALEENLDAQEYSVLTQEDCRFKFKIVEYFEKIKSFFL